MPETDGADWPAETSRTATVRRLRAGQVAEGADRVAVETPVAFEYNGVSHAVMLASPADLEDFAVGFSLTEGIVGHSGQIRDAEVTTGAAGITLQLTIASECFAGLKERRRTLAGRTGCGLCGTDSLLQAVRPPPRLQSASRFDAATVSRALAGLQRRQVLRNATGATHAAAWCNAAGGIELLREDVGRHNALDKVIGALFRAGTPAETGFMLVTSRASYEMVHKTAMAGVTLLAAVSGVTALAVDMAGQAGLCLLGFVRGDDLSIYTHAERVCLSASVP